MTIRSVGPGQPYSTIGAAVGASQDGDVLQIQAGTYTNDFAEINASITLQGVGGMVRVAATVPPPDGKAAFTINDNATFDHFEISGVQVRDLNGAAFRLQAGDLTLQDCYIHDNQTGILTTDNPDATLTILESEFARNISSGSSPATGLSHGIYVNGIGRLTIDDSYFHDASTGHHIKSRALETTITDSRIFDNAGTASYSIDLPNGGDVLIANNVIQQGAGSQNPFIIAFGEEGGIRPGSSLEVRDNVVVDDLPGGALLWNPASLPATLAGNDVFGLTASELASGPATITGTTFLATRPTLDQSSPWAGGGTTQSGTGAADTLSGGAGADSIAGFASADSLTGLGGTDTIVGGAGNDTLAGGAGDDVLVGGAGNDLLLGGAGNDRFLANRGGGRDTIRGFDADPVGGQDRIDLTPMGVTAANFAALVGITQAANGALVTVADTSILLAGISASVLDHTDFIVG